MSSVADDGISVATHIERLKHQVQAVLDRQTDTNELARKVDRLFGVLQASERAAAKITDNLEKTLERVATRVAMLDRLSDHFDEALVTTQEEFERQLLQTRVKQSALESRIEQLEADAATTRNALRVAISGPRVFVVEEKATPSEDSPQPPSDSEQ